MRTIQDEEGAPLALFETYLAMIHGSIGSHQYRKLYVCRAAGLDEVIGNGDLACAYYVSSILTLCELSRGGVHTTVTETIRDLEDSGWQKIDSWKTTPFPFRGSIVVWAEKMSDTDRKMHRHIGFCISLAEAVSNQAAEKSPQKHDLTFRPEGRTELDPPVREIEAYYFFPGFHLES